METMQCMWRDLWKWEEKALDEILMLFCPDSWWQVYMINSTFCRFPTNASVVSILTTSTSTALPAHSGWSCFNVSPRGISCHCEFFGFHHIGFSSHSFLMFPFPGFLFEVLFHLMWKISQFYVIGSSIKFHFLESCWSPSLRGGNK